MSASVRVQPDWEATKPGETFWINARALPDTATVYGQALLNASNAIQVDHSSIQARLTTSPLTGCKELEVTAFGTTFHVVSPTSVESKTKGKRIEHLDVSPQGGLIARTHQDGFVGIYSTDPAQRGEPPARVLTGAHLGDVYFCKFFPSGKVALTGGADTTLRIWDLEEFYGEPDALIKGHQGAVTCAEFVGRGRNIVSGSRDGTGRLWDVPTQTMIHLYATQTGPVNSVALWKDANAVDSPAEDSRDFGTEGNLFILGTEEGAVHVFDLRQRDRLFQMTSTGAVNAVAVTAATGTIVAGAADGALSGWDIRTLQNGNGNSQPTMSLRRETAAVTALKTVGSSVIACHGDGAAYMWDITTSSSLLDFCGPDYDPLFTIAAGEVGQTATLFTGGRDGILRSYRLPHM